MSHVSYAEPPAQGWDIHCHTVFSDGTETLRTLVEQARKLGLHGVAIADHDTTAGWDEATEASEEIDLPLLLGTEITAVDEDVSVHMLAFQYDPSNEHISSMFANTRAARLRRTKRMVERLSQDFPITWDDVLAQVKEGAHHNRPSAHCRRAGRGGRVRDAFRRVRRRGERQIQVLHSHAVAVDARGHRRRQGAGGVVVAAHAGDPQRNRRLLSDEQLDATIADGLTAWKYGIAAILRNSGNDC